MINEYGSSARLQNVLVTELVEYERTAGYESGSEFDDDNADDGEGKNVKVPASAKGKPAAKTTVKPKPTAKPAEDEFDDDIPF